MTITIDDVGDSIQNAWNTYYNNPVFNNGKYNLSPIGAIVIAAHIVLTLLYLLLSWLIKIWRRWRRMDPAAAGSFRLAAAQGDIEKLQLLKKCYLFNINASVEGWTALHAAAAMGQPASTAWLLKKGAKLNAKKDDHWNDSPLHYAAASGSLETVKVLLAYGADPRDRNFAGLTPRDYAMANNHVEVANHLGMVMGALGDMPNVPSVQAAQRDHFYNSAAAHTRTPSTSGTPDANQTEQERKKRTRRQISHACRRGYEGIGTPGTKRTWGCLIYRVLALVSTALGLAYLFWRAFRSLNDGWYYFYSIPLFTCEWLGWLSWLLSVIGLWSTIDREERNLKDMMPEERFPHVDVYIVCYNEPVSVIEPTTIAALNMNYPADKLTVYILDDGKREEVQNMAMKLDFQCQYFRRRASICYISREKVKGVPHHAKAGNINHALLKAGVVRGEYVLVLDCDMIVHPDFLLRSMGHFYRLSNKGQWMPKEKVGFLQTPQNFWNIEKSDPMFHLNSFFYGPMLKGRDGLGATPCCGTGVIFRRDVLVSIGGQSYGSVTEDFNTAMHLLMCGFSTMYLNEHMTYGMAPDDIPSTFSQRLRWAIGAVQVYLRNNPLRIPGLTHVQSLMFYDACASHFLAICVIFVAVVPIVYLFTSVSPLKLYEGHVWEFTAFFLGYYLSNRITLLWAFHDSKSGMHELWRTSQQAVWIAPNHLKATWKVLRTELPVIRWLSKFEIGFAVTRKEKQNDRWRQFKDTFSAVWPYLLYYIAGIGSVVYVIVGICLSWYSGRQIAGFSAGAGWMVLVALCIWPPIYTLLPRIYTDDGWKVVWKLPNVMGGTASSPIAEPEHAAARDVVKHETPTLMRALGLGAEEEPTVTQDGIDAAMPIQAVATNGTVAPHSTANAMTTVPAPNLPPIRTRPSRRSSTRGNSTTPASIAIPMPTTATTADQVFSNFGRVGVRAFPRAASLQRQGSSLAQYMSEDQLERMYTDLSVLYHQVSRLVYGTTSEGASGNASLADNAARFPPIAHTADSRTDANRTFNLGPLEMRIREAAYDVVDYHNPRGLEAPIAGNYEDPQRPPATPALLRAMQSSRHAVSPAIHVAPDRQWVSSRDAYRGQGEQFISFGQNKHVGLSLLLDSLEYAMRNGQTEQERMQLFARFLFSSVSAPSSQDAADAALGTPHIPAPGLAIDQNIMAQPDFENKTRPPQNYTFIVVFGLLIVGLAVAGILDATGVL